MRLASIMAAVALGLVAAGCGGGTPPTPPPASAPGSTPAAPATPATGAGPGGAAPIARPKEPEAGPPLAPMAYEPKGRRDPFAPVVLTREAGGLTVSSVKLVGIVQGRQGLLALVEAPDGIGYILKQGDALGDGRVTALTANSVTFAVATRGSQKATMVTLRLATE